jgi:hypothetical protein
MQRISIKKCFADDEEVETEVRKWLGQQAKYFYAAGFDALLKRSDKCISVGGAFVEKYMFCSLYSFVTCLLELPHIFKALLLFCSGGVGMSWHCCTESH